MLSAVAGFAAGVAFGAIFGALAIPAGIAGLLTFGFSVGAGVVIDKYAAYRNHLHYWR